MTITNHPLHRSGRALLTHPAPALGDDAKSSQGIRVMKRGRWQPTASQTLHLLPSKTGLLAATTQRPTPVTDHLKAKRRQRVQVRRHTIVPIVSRDYRPKPLAHFGHSMVHSFAQFRFDFLQLGSFPLTHRAPIDREHSAALLATDVREAQKVECLRLPFATPLSITEYVVGLILASIATSTFGLVVMIVLASFVFGLSFFIYGALLIPFIWTGGFRVRRDLQPVF